MNESEMIASRERYRYDHPEVGDILKAGELVLLTSGSYSDYGVGGLYRVRSDIVVPGRPAKWGRPGELEPDTEKLSVALEEVAYREVWRDN